MRSTGAAVQFVTGDIEAAHVWVRKTASDTDAGAP